MQLGPAYSHKRIAAFFGGVAWFVLWGTAAVYFRGDPPLGREWVIPAGASFIGGGGIACLVAAFIYGLWRDFVSDPLP